MKQGFTIVVSQFLENSVWEQEITNKTHIFSDNLKSKSNKARISLNDITLITKVSDQHCTPKLQLINTKGQFEKTQLILDKKVSFIR